MADLTTNINQAISDFNSIKQAIVNKGVEVPDGTKTSEYAGLIAGISGSEMFDIFISTGSSNYIFKIDKEGWASGFYANDSYTTVVMIESNFLPEASDWEMAFCFMLTSEPTRSNVLFGSYQGAYYYSPSVEIQSLTGIWAGYSISGSSWDKGVMITDVSLELNKEYYIKYQYSSSSSSISLSLSEDGQNWTNTQETVVSKQHYQPTSQYGTSIGGIMKSNNHFFNCGKINLFKSYIKVGEDYYFGNGG